MNYPQTFPTIRGFRVIIKAQGHRDCLVVPQEAQDEQFSWGCALRQADGLN